MICHLSKLDKFNGEITKFLISPARSMKIVFHYSISYIQAKILLMINLYSTSVQKCPFGPFQQLNIYTCTLLTSSIIKLHQPNYIIINKIFSKDGKYFICIQFLLNSFVISCSKNSMSFCLHIAQSPSLTIISYLIFHLLLLCQVNSQHCELLLKTLTSQSIHTICLELIQNFVDQIILLTPKVL